MKGVQLFLRLRLPHIRRYLCDFLFVFVELQWDDVCSCYITALRRFYSSSISSSTSGDLCSNGDDAAIPENLNKDEDEQLLSMILGLRLPKNSATTVLQKWVEGGNILSVSHLRHLSMHLTACQRYKHALEISEWMITHEKSHGALSESDHGRRLHLIGKVFGISTAERYFESSSSDIKCSETCTALLHLYCSSGLTEKAEELYDQVSVLEVPPDVIFYNEMMTLYVSIGQYEKVEGVIVELRRRGLSPDLFSYNQWVSSCAASGDKDGLKQVMEDMSRDDRVRSDESWGRYAVLVGAYMEAEWASATHGDQVRYELLMILHTSRGKTAVVKEMWRGVCGGKIGSNYKCGLLCYVMLGETEAAEEAAAEWRRRNSEGGEGQVGIWDGVVAALSEHGFVEKADTLRRLVVCES